MNEETLVITVDLPPGQDWAWYADLNIVGLSSHLCTGGRERALFELQAAWRRRFVRIVPPGGEGDTVSSDMLVG